MEHPRRSGGEGGVQLGGEPGPSTPETDRSQRRAVETRHG